MATAAIVITEFMVVTADTAGTAGTAAIVITAVTEAIEEDPDTPGTTTVITAHGSPIVQFGPCLDRQAGQDLERRAPFRKLDLVTESVQLFEVISSPPHGMNQSWGKGLINLGT
ncbi:MAG: hypothetical protein ACKVP0_10145 [Pirellulaceae bacterium]